MNNMKASCAWEAGLDVLISLNGEKMILHNDPIDLDKFTHGTITEGSVDLTIEEAEDLAHQLLNSVHQVKELNQICEDHDDAVHKILQKIIKLIKNLKLLENLVLLYKRKTVEKIIITKVTNTGYNMSVDEDDLFQNKPISVIESTMINQNIGHFDIDIFQNGIVIKMD